MRTTHTLVQHFLILYNSFRGEMAMVQGEGISPWTEEGNITLEMSIT